MKGEDLAWHPAVLRRALPGEDGRLCGAGYSQCGGAALCHTLASIRSSGCFWSGRPAGRASCSGAACVWRVTPSRWRATPCPPCWPMYPPTPFWRACASRRRTGLWGRPLGEVDLPAYRRHEEHHRGPDRGHRAAPGPHDPGAELQTSYCPWWWLSPCLPSTGGWGLALLVTIPVALIPMAFGLRTYNKKLRRLHGGQRPCEQRHCGVCGGYPGGQSLQPGGAVLSEIRQCGEILP